MPRTATNLAAQTEAQLAALRLKATQRLQDEKAVLAAIDAEKKARADAARAKEERRLGKLAYAAGLAGVEAGVLEKQFAGIAEALMVAAEAAGVVVPEEEV